MSSFPSTLSRLLACCAAAVLLLTSVQEAHAQADQPRGRLNVDFDRQSDKSFQTLINQWDEPKLGPRETNLIDLAAKHHAYRLTWIELHNAPGAMAKVVGDVDYLIQQFQANAKKGARNDNVRQQFLRQLVERIKEVMGTPWLIARVNGARMLAVVAEYNFPEVAGALVEVVQDDKQHDAVRYYAFQGLRKVYEQAQLPDAAPMKNREREANAVLAALKVVGRKLPANLPREEKEGARLFRREALRFLAQTRSPVVMDDKNKQVRERPALVLLRAVAQPEGLSPEARLDEQVEAAVGLARMQTRLAPDYQPDYAVHHLSGFVVRLAERYQKDSKDTVEPWRIHAARLSEALEAMRQDSAKVKDKDMVRYVEEAVKRAAPILVAIEQNRTPNPSNLNSWLISTPSKSTMLFRDVPESAIKPMEAELKTEEKPPSDKPPEKK